jgi:hypothetical protein
MRIVPSACNNNSNTRIEQTQKRTGLLHREQQPIVLFSSLFVKSIPSSSHSLLFLTIFLKSLSHRENLLRNHKKQKANWIKL